MDLWRCGVVDAVEREEDLMGMESMAGALRAE